MRLTSLAIALGMRAFCVHARNSSLPSQAVTIDPSSFAVLAPNGTFRTNPDTGLFNPTNTTAPFFQIFNPAFLTLLGPNASITEIASNDTFAFAHEAPIWVEKTNRVYFASNDAGVLPGESPPGPGEHYVRVAFLELDEVEDALAGSEGGSVNVTITEIPLPDTLQMTNGGTGPHQGSLLLIQSGNDEIPPNLTLVNPEPPYNTTVLLDNFYGRQFNSLNDIKVRPKSGNFFFTDMTHGFLLGFRPAPKLPNQVYRFDPKSGSVRVVADGFDKSNGIAFTPDGSVAYIADTGMHNGPQPIDLTAPATIYAFDVDPTTELFINRRVFAFVDTGIADGLQVDRDGNVYGGCGEGVQVWDSAGTLLGKFFLNQKSANMVFAGDGNLVILAETKIFLARVAARGQDLTS